MKRRPTWWIVLLFAFSFMASADPLRPGYLEIKQSAPSLYSVLLKVPAQADRQRLPIHVQFGAGAIHLNEPQPVEVNGALIERWVVRRDGGLAGSEIEIAGLEKTTTDVLVRVEQLDGSSQVARLTPARSSFTIASSPSSLQVISTYSLLGFEHILLGFDHLLFVLGLLLIVGLRWLVLIKTITAFTVAHSITLALATLGWVNIPSTPVEAVIALSIMFVAGEILHARAGRPGITARAPWLVALAFGLLHGFGFAGALMETGLPQNAVPLALLFFNIGVELGQLLFVAVVSLIMMATSKMRRRFPKWSEALVPYSIGGLAAFWTLERLSSMVA